jgi:hypothetical protein
MESKISFTLLLIFLTLNILFADSTGTVTDVSSIELKTYVEDDEVPANREVVYHVELSWLGPLSQFEIDDIDEPVTTNLNLRSSGSSNKFFLDPGGKPHSVRRITFYFTPVEMGMAYIDGVIIHYRDKKVGQESSLMAQRLGVKVINPVPDHKNRVLSSETVLWLVTILFLGVVGFFVIRYMQRRTKRQPVYESEHKTLEEKYMELLHETIHSSGESPAENLNELVRLLNSYLAERSDRQESGDFTVFKNLADQAALDQDLIRKIKNLYDRSELTKFAGESLTQSDFHLFYDSVEQLLKCMQERRSESEVEPVDE